MWGLARRGSRDTGLGTICTVHNVEGEGGKVECGRLYILSPDILGHLSYLSQDSVIAICTVSSQAGSAAAQHSSRCDVPSYQTPAPAHNSV